MVGEITCSHSIQYYDVILWYRQDGQKALKLLGFLNTNTEYVDGDAKGKFSIDGDGRSHSTLSISDITLSDGGIYFCAASSHSVAPSCQHGSKTRSCCSTSGHHYTGCWDKLRFDAVGVLPTQYQAFSDGNSDGRSDIKAFLWWVCLKPLKLE